MKKKKEILELKERVKDLELRIDKLEKTDHRLEIENLKSHIISLRGLVNRKLGEIIPKPPQEEEFKNPDGLDELRGI